MIQIHRVPATIIGVLIAAIVVLCIVCWPSVSPAAEYELPVKVGGETLSVDTESFDPMTLAVLGGGGYGIWSWLKGRKGDGNADVMKFIQSLLGLWGKLPGDRKPTSFDGTVNFETGEPYTFHLSLGGKKTTPEVK